MHLLQKFLISVTTGLVPLKLLYFVILSFKYCKFMKIDLLANKQAISLNN